MCVCVCVCIYICICIAVSAREAWASKLLMMIVYPRETPPHIRTARAQPPAAHRRRHSRLHHRRHGKHSPTARQPHSNGLYSPPPSLRSRRRPPSSSRLSSAPSSSANPARPATKAERAEDWSLQDIRLCIRGLCTSQYYSWHATPALVKPPPVVFCNQYCAVYGFPPPSLFCHSTYNIGNSNIV